MVYLVISEDAKFLAEKLDKLGKSIDIMKGEKKVKTIDEPDFLTLNEIDEHLAKKYGLKIPSEKNEEEDEEDW